MKGHLPRVLIYTHSFAPHVGGVETYVMLLAQGLAGYSGQSGARELEVTIATRTPAGRMDDASLPFRVMRRPGVLALLRLIWRAEVIHLAGPCMLPLWLAVFLRKPVVIEHHGYQAICPNGLLLYEPARTVCPGHFMSRHYLECLRCNATNSGIFKSLVQLLLTFPRRWALKLATANLPITQHVRNRIRLPRSRVIYYGIPDSCEKPEPPLTNSEGFQVDTPVFAYVGRLVAEKGVRVLVQSAKELVDAGYSFRVKIIGDGPERAALENDAAALGLQGCVSFAGWLQGAPLKAEVENVSAVVMPTLMEETAGLALIEHMMRGGLVIASDIGGMGEVVDGAGLKFVPGSVPDLVSCLRLVLDDPSIVKTLGAKARARAQELFTQDRMVDEHLSLYHEISGSVWPAGSKAFLLPRGK